MAKQPDSVRIELTPESVAFIEKMQDSPAILSEGIRVGLNRANPIALSRVQRERFTGRGPFPVSQNRLGVVSGRLNRSLQTYPVEILNPQRLEVETAMGSSLGSAVKYFAKHEFGFSGTVQVGAHTRTRDGKSFRVKSHRRKMNVPERRPLRAGLESADVQEIYQEEIETGLVNAFENLT